MVAIAVGALFPKHNFLTAGQIFYRSPQTDAIFARPTRIRLRMRAAPLGTALIRRAVWKIAPSEADNSATGHVTAFKMPPTENLAPVTVYSATQSPMGDTFFRGRFRFFAISRQTVDDTASSHLEKLCEIKFPFVKMSSDLTFGRRLPRYAPSTEI